MAEKKRMLFLSFIAFGSCDSGSCVRPQQMARAFEQAGFEVYLHNGSQRRDQADQRRQSAKRIVEQLRVNRPDFCYIEPASDPMLYRFDRALIRKISRLGIPIGYFFRDAHYSLGRDFLPKAIGLRQKLSRFRLRLYHLRDERLIARCADIVYFPSQTMASCFSFSCQKLLPPAAQGMLRQSPATGGNTCIFVGGLSKAYGAELMLEAFEQLNEAGTYPLILVCREKEKERIPVRYRTTAWLNVCHASGPDALGPLYNQAALALYPLEKSRYADLAVSVKLFEYMSYALPIATTDNIESARLIRAFEVGGVSGHSPQAFAQTVRALLADRKRLAEFSQNAARAVEQGNRWIDRARTVAQDLEAVKDV